MMKNIWRYSINEGERGGIVIAYTKESAESKVKCKYKDVFDWNNCNTELLVWQMIKDDYFDENNPDVWDCYGL